VQIADALIAATAVVHGVALVTANITDFAVAGLTTIRLEGPQ
jgi:predicted nucleic acid-binding protein